MSTVTGAFDDYGVVAQVVEDLKHSGIDSKRIFVLGPKSKDSKNTFASNVNYADAVRKLMLWTSVGAFIGLLFAVGGALVMHSDPPLITQFVAGLCGASAGGYLGLLIAAVTRGDFGGKEKSRELSLTRGIFWVGVDARKPEELGVSKKIMAELGAIEIEPPYELANDRLQRAIFIFSWIVSVLLLFAFFGLGVLASYGHLAMGPGLKVWTLVCYLGILLCTFFTAFAGFRSRGAQKWLHMEKDSL